MFASLFEVLSLLFCFFLMGFLVSAGFSAFEVLSRHLSRWRGKKKDKPL